MSLQSSDGRIRFAKGSRGGLLLLLVISADWQSRFSKLIAADSPRRPYSDASGHSFSDSSDPAYSDASGHSYSDSSDHAYSDACGHSYSDSSDHAYSDASGHSYSDSSDHAYSDAADHPSAESSDRTDTSSSYHRDLDASDRTDTGSSFHPDLDTKDIKSEVCLTCHPTKNQGKFVHTAVGLGCQSCHQVVSREHQTAITLRATGGNLCAKCHETKDNPVMHGPYRAGQCLICHNPHSASHKAQTRADISTLCLSCHMLNQPAVTLAPQRGTVSLPDGVTYDLAAWQSAPKIGTHHSEKKTASRDSEQVSGKKPVKDDAELNCLACHDPHASKAEHLLRHGAENRGADRFPANLSVRDCVYAKAGSGYVPENQGLRLRGQL
jgi:predicted CXXCH cytochrome family protein